MVVSSSCSSHSAVRHEQDGPTPEDFRQCTMALPTLNMDAWVPPRGTPFSSSHCVYAVDGLKSSGSVQHEQDGPTPEDFRQYTMVLPTLNMDDSLSYVSRISEDDGLKLVPSSDRALSIRDGVWKLSEYGLNLVAQIGHPGESRLTETMPWEQPYSNILAVSDPGKSRVRGPRMGSHPGKSRVCPIRVNVRLERISTRDMGRPPPL